MATITIHYKSPKGDPFKIPRPHRISLDDVLSGKPEGGEIGPLNALLGFSPTETPDVDDWVMVLPHEVAEHPDEYEGWFAQFSDDDGMFGYEIPVDRIVVSV